MSQDDPSAFEWKSARLEHRDRLPHVRQENVIYFVTFRLGDSLAAEHVTRLQVDRQDWLERNPLPHTPEQIQEYRRIWTVRIERLLDAGYGECVLRDAECRVIVERCMRHDDGPRYRLGDFVIMPNHVHALVHVLPGFELAEAVKAWKSISARGMGKQVGRRGSFWMEEYFDHAVRSEESLNRFVEYIRNNPTNLPPGSSTLGCGSMRVK
jgi:putative transposase